MTGKRKRYKKRTLNFPWSKQTVSRARKAEDGTDLDPLLAYRSGIRRTDEIQTVGESWQAVRTLTSVDDTYGLPIRVETAGKVVTRYNSDGLPESTSGLTW